MTKRRVNVKRNARWKMIQFAFFFCVFVCVFALIWLRTTVVNLEYELSQLGKQKWELVREGKSILAEKASFYSVEKIEHLAINRLGMSLPQRDKVFFVKKTGGAVPYAVSIKKTVPGDSLFKKAY